MSDLPVKVQILIYLSQDYYAITISWDYYLKDYRSSEVIFFDIYPKIHFYFSHFL